MLQRFLARLVDTLGAQAGILLLYDAHQERLVVRAAHPYDPAALDEARCARVYRTARPEFYPDPEAPARTAGQTPTSGVCLPLISGETRPGVLVIDGRRASHSFSRDDLPFMQAAAHIIAPAIECAQLRQELETTRQLGEANRLKAELITTLAHEMRTPLTSIKGYATALLMDEVSFAPQTQREFLQFIDEECDVLQALVHDLLESSIVDAGLLKLERQPVRLPQLVKNVTDDMARHTELHRFLVDFPERFPILDADPDRMVQVLRNLLDNAVKYSPDGGLIIVRGELRPDEAVVSVADQGVGLTAEHLNRLFEKYFRARSSPDGHVVGSGLGLPISRTIVESHGGRIWAESQIDQGTTLYFTLPLDGEARQHE